MTAVHPTGVVVFDGVKLLDVAGPTEVLAEANLRGATYELRLLSVGGTAVTSSTGLTLGAQGDAEDPDLRLDTLIVAGGDRLPVAPIEAELVAAVAGLAERARRTCSVCTGAFVLAAAGLLDGRRATTHWRHTQLLGDAYRGSVAVDPDAIFVRDGDVYTSAGVSAGIDLALALVEADHGSELARSVAQSLVVYLQRPGGQSQFSPALAAPRPRTPVLRDVLDAVLADPAGDHSPARLAARAALSVRHLTRLFAAEVGRTPGRYVEMVRLDAAKTALARGAPVGVAARVAGFRTAEAMRRAFVAQLGVTPRAYQQRFVTARTSRALPGPGAPAGPQRTRVQGPVIAKT